MLLIFISAILGALIILPSMYIWHYTRVKQAEIQYGSQKRIDALEEETKRLANIVNRMDEEALEQLVKTTEAIRGQLKDVTVGNMLRRR